MALAFTTKEHETDTSGTPFDTGSISTWTAGCRGAVLVAAANSGGTVSAVGVTGGGVTWSEETFVGYGFRRGDALMVSDGTPATGALTITVTVSGSYQETIYDVIQVTGFNTGTPHDTANGVGIDDTAGTTITNNDLGTIDAGDLALSLFTGENANDGITSTDTQISKTEDGGNVRSFLSAYGTDDTPSATIDTSGIGRGTVGVIWNVGAAPAGGRIMSSLADHGGLAGHGGIAGLGGGLAG